MKKVNLNKLIAASVLSAMVWNPAAATEKAEAKPVEQSAAVKAPLPKRAALVSAKAFDAESLNLPLFATFSISSL